MNLDEFRIIWDPKKNSTYSFLNPCFKCGVWSHCCILENCRACFFSPLARGTVSLWTASHASSTCELGEKRLVDSGEPLKQSHPIPRIATQLAYPLTISNQQASDNFNIATWKISTFNRSSSKSMDHDRACELWNYQRRSWHNPFWDFWNKLSDQCSCARLEAPAQLDSFWKINKKMQQGDQKGLLDVWSVLWLSIFLDGWIIWKMHRFFFGELTWNGP